MRLLIPLFSPATGTLGGLTRGLAIANAAKVAGHEVAFCASGPVEHELRARGQRVFPVPAPTMFGLPRPLSDRIRRRVERSAVPSGPGPAIGSIWTVLVALGYGNGGYLRRLVEAQRAAIDTFRAQALFTDLDPGAYLLAATTGLPLGSAFQSILWGGQGSLSWRLMARALGSVLRREGRPPDAPEDLFWGRHVLKLVPSIPELDGGGPARDDLRYVGHLAAPLGSSGVDDFDPEPGTRYLFAYIGTGSLPMARLERVLPEAFHGDGLRCVVGAGSTIEPHRIGSVEFRRFIPASRVLPVADWTLCHGGLNTVIDSLRAGVPLMLVPGSNFERRFNAKRVSAEGAGLVVEARDFSAVWVRAALRRRDELLPGARRLGAAIEAAGGPAAAICELERWEEGRHAVEG